jgi:two-component system, chemotaxis family, sensor kinase CheA
MHMTLDDGLQVYIVDSRELLNDMESALLSIQEKDADKDTINAIFRAAHTIKGSAGLFGLDHLIEFTHVVESVLEQVRNGTVRLGPDLVSLLLACRDHIGALLDHIESTGADGDVSLTEQGMPLLLALLGYLPDPPPAETQVIVRGEESDAVERISDPTTNGDSWHISLRFGFDVLKNGMDPFSFLRYLGTIGTIVDIITIHAAIPAAEEMDPELCYLGFEIAFKSEADKAVIESVFEFVRDDCKIHILPPRSRTSEYIRLIRDAADENIRLGEMLTRCGTLTQYELENALRAQAESDLGQPLGAILVDQGLVTPPVLDAALNKQNVVRAAKGMEASSIRIDADKLDHLINLVGELIVASASTHLIARKTHNVELRECSAILSSLIEDVRNSALQLRMVKIGATFNRFQRMAHDVALELGKDIGLIIQGESTELDKTVVEKVADPLTHLVRNAMDHGIEPAAVRLARGKPKKGTITLNAYHDAGTVVIEVRDDGEGMDREKILARAVERGLVDAEQSLSDSEIHQLVFEPGFSTAEKISNISGRGVGMDIVKRNITALRGTVGIHSEANIGTTITVRLPLTLAIINGFQVSLGRSVFVIPLDMVEECVEFSSEYGHDYAALGDEILPFIRLHEVFETGDTPARRQSIVVVKYAGQRAGLVVDTLLGEAQTVIKPLGKALQRVKCISGSSILGNGDVALILDVPELIRQAHEVPASVNYKSLTH